ncbi:MAG TPA: calcium-binding protein, partial [Methylibium sp.]|nr:calcium-binding protein [Methylibium sp.]
DSLVGGAGNDSLDGGSGADTMVGGADNDTYVVDNAGDVVTEAVDAGLDAVRSSRSYTLGANLENLVLTGSGAINGTGNALANSITGNGAANRLSGGGANDTLNGGAGNDTLNGGSGADTQIGGAGGDVYYVNNAGDVVTEAANAGTDTVNSTLSYTLGTNVENLVLGGTAAINGTGNSLANRITGNAGNNVLNGGSGNDTLGGGGGNDTLVGGAGNDMLTGGAGGDTFRFASALNAGTNVDHMADFNAVDDRIQLENAVFTALGATGALAAAAFTTGTAAGDASDRVIYDSVGGRLFYDADGSGAGAAVLFATVTAGTTVTAADVFVT